MDTQVLFYATIVLTAVMGAILGYVAISYRKLIEKYERIRQSQEEAGRALEQEKAKVLEQGRLEAQKIISEAQANAAQLVAEAGTFSDQSREVLAQELKKVQAAEIDYYQKALQETKRAAQASLGGISKDVRDEVVRQIDAVRIGLTSEIQKAQSETRQILTSSYKKMEEEIAAYKKERLKAVDEKVFEILKAVSVKAIGKSLSFEDHEDAVLKALEEAKAENVL
jgi:F0F1-type ATP synthase membrane subunit b/b'